MKDFTEDATQQSSDKNKEKKIAATFFYHRVSSLTGLVGTRPVMCPFNHGKSYDGWIENMPRVNC